MHGKGEGANLVQTYVYYAGVVIFSVEALNLVAQIWNLLNSRHRGGKSGNKTGGVSFVALVGKGFC